MDTLERVIRLIVAAVIVVMVIAVSWGSILLLVLGSIAILPIALLAIGGMMIAERITERRHQRWLRKHILGPNPPDR